ncbi:REJ domain-containing protein [Pseudoalteromonas sp. Of7M-16]|uniref:PKD domain-containing protein n=1 Tax=Pseudoalteromonas sp. Of7M-16 TaxID=2917756 RepID=UPI001EF68C6A|nr:REJ domain-containing protein [Pseudoalteromonas sp. Of7M-16]MCG7550419.1 hypothetical protein [Pseudoalteromonas sp. Of7M-16]
MRSYIFYRFVLKVFLVCFTVLGLSACGGSGGSDSAANTGSTGNTNVEPPKAINAAPKVTIEGLTETTQQVAITLNAIASDSDGNIASYAWSFDPNLPISADNLTDSSLTIVSLALDEDITFDASVVVTDNLGKQTSATHTVKVYAPDIAPLNINILGTESELEQQAFQLTLEATEPLDDSAQITWSHDSELALDLSGSDSTTLTVVSPDILENQTVHFNAEVKLSDNREAKHTHVVTIKALANVPPEVSIVGNHKVLEGVTLALRAEASDQDGEVVTYAWSHNTNLDINLAGEQSENLSASIENIVYDQTVVFTVEVTDNQGTSSQESITVQVTALPNVAPTAVIKGENTVTEQAELVLTAEASDSDGQVEFYSWSYTSDIAFTVSGLQSETLTLQSGDIVEDHTAVVSLQVTDNQGASHTVEHTVTIEALPNVAPDASIQVSQETVERQAFTLTGISSDVDGRVSSHSWSHNSPLTLLIDGQNTNAISVVSPDIQTPHEVTFTYTATDNQGASTSVSQLVTIEPIQIAFSVTGKVTDAPIPFAQVTMQIGEATFEANADENGDYTLDVAVDESQAAELVKLSAKGINDKSTVSLVSQLNSVSTIKEAAGDDNLVNAEELFDVNVTNVTTAEYALLARDTQGYSNNAELNDAKARISSQEQLTLAAVLKAVIDHGVALPDGVNSTLELAKNSELVDELLDNLTETQPELVEQIKSEITNDETLVAPVAFAPNGTYYLLETNYVDGLDYKLAFYEDQRGLLSTADKRIPFSWAQNGKEVTINLDQEVVVNNEQFEHRTGFHSSSFKITTYDLHNKSLAVMVEFDVSRDIEELPNGKYTTAAQVFGERDLNRLTEDALVGTWSLAYSQFGEKNNFELTFRENGQVAIDTGITVWDGTWRIHLGQVEVSHWVFGFNLKLAREFNFGYQTIVETGSFGEEVYRQGTFIKHQDISFDDIDYQKTWRKAHSKKSHSAFTVDNNDNFNFRWHRDIHGQNDNGILTRFDYYLDGNKVDFCNTELSSCRIDTVYQYKLLAQIGDTIAVAYFRNRLNVSDRSRDIHFYKLSEKTWALGKFTKSFFNTDKLERLFGAQTHLYSVNGETISHLYSDFYCPTNPSPLRLCFDSIVFNGERYRASLENEKLKLEHLQSGAISYMAVSEETDKTISLCHFAEGASCSQGSNHSFVFSKPELTVNVSQIGEGELTISQSQFYFGDRFNITISEVGDYSLENISGCGGVLKTIDFTKVYQVPKLESSCEITATFQERIAHKHTSLLLDATPAGFVDSWYYTFDADSQIRGTFFGQDKNTAFTVRNIQSEMYIFEFEQTIQTRVNGKLFFASRFTLRYGADSLYACWNGSKKDDNFDPKSAHLEATCTYVESASSKQATELEVSELLGDWHLNFDLSSNQYQLTLNEDNTGVFMSLLGDGSIASAQYINWQLNRENMLELTDETGAVASFSVIEKNASLYTLLANQTGGENQADWLRYGSWSMIRTERKPWSLEQLKGAWVAVDEQSIENFYLFSGGEYRSGKLNGAGTVALERNTLTISASFNKSQNRFEHICNDTRPECEVRSIAQFKVIALDNARAYIHVYQSNDYQSSVRIIDIDDTFSVENDNPVYLESAKYYEKLTGSIRTWEFIYNGTGSNVVVRVGDDASFFASYDKGEIKSVHNPDNFTYRVLDIDSDGLTVCRMVSGQCSAHNQIQLLFQLPFVEVTLDIPDALEARHNAGSGYLKYGEKLEVTLNRSNQQRQYASAFSGCGITKPSWLNFAVITFSSPALTQSCSLQMTAAPLPDSNADRLGITDPVLKSCVDREASEYVEYDHQFFCSNYRGLSSLEGIEKLHSLTSLGLQNFSLTAEGLQRLEQLTNLEEFSAHTNLFDELQGPVEVDFSGLEKLKKLTLTRLPEGSLTLPNTATLKELSLVSSALTEIDLSGLSGLEDLSIYNSSITALDLSNNKKLTMLDARSSALQSITGVTADHQLQIMNLKSTQFESLDLTGFERLTYLYLSKSQIREIDISKAKALLEFDAQVDGIFIKPHSDFCKSECGTI